jgi:hypothetical protein
MPLNAGDWVEVRSKAEILRSLDAKGRLDNLPFMPQMFNYCGQRFRVYKRAHKTCDTVGWSGGRRLANGIHLENLRCDGKVYGDCQAACLIFWKEAWLKPLDDGSAAQASRQSAPSEADATSGGCSESAVLLGTLAHQQPPSGGPRYACQATELPTFTTPLAWWDIRQYWEDYVSGNVPMSRLFSGFVYASYYYLSRPGQNPVRRVARWLYDQAQGIRGGVPFPRYYGSLPVNSAPPIAPLDLQPGELVRVKAYPEILATLDTNNKNRGLFFDAEMVPFCDRTFRARSKVNQFVNEQTGIVTRLKTPAVILENVWCHSRYSDCRMGCPRSIYSWWREAWLERVPVHDAASRDSSHVVKVGAQDLLAAQHS